MLKFLEKGPISRWKIIQRLMHRRRNSRRSGSDKFKTFDTSLAPKSDSTVIIEHDSINQDYTENSEQITPHMTLSHTAPEGFRHSSSEVEKPVRRTKSDENIISCVDEVTSSASKKQEAASSGLSLSERVALSRSNSARIKAWKDSHDTEGEPLTETDEQDSGGKSSTQQNPFHRTSRFRSSLRELKKRSASHMDSVRESMRRKVNTRKYDNLDRGNTAAADEDEKIVDYEKSPGTRRRQVIDL